MKRLSILLSVFLLLIGLGACNKECNEEIIPEPTSLKLNQTAVTLKVGETSQLTANIEPKDQTYTVTFASDKETIATVDHKGLITAVAEGTATITATVGKLTERCVVTVTTSGSTKIINELPVLKFDPTFDKETKRVNSPEILDHEKALGRVAQNITLGEDQTLPGFVNTNLTITATIYGLYTSGTNHAIFAFSKESVDDCPKTIAMLAEYGFTTLEESNKGHFLQKLGVKDDDSTVHVTLFDAPISALQSTLQIIISKEYPRKGLDVAHALIPTVEDFPSYTDLMTGDVAKIKAFETSLGFRSYNAEKSDEAKVNLQFETPSAKQNETNYAWVRYVFTPSGGPKASKRIDCQVNFIKQSSDLNDPKIKEWFALNGFDNDFTNFQDQFVYAYDATGEIFCFLFIDNAETGAYLQIYKNPKTQSASQRRRLAIEHYESIKNARPILPSTKL